MIFQMFKFVFLLIKECAVAIQTSVFQMRTRLLNYLAGNIFENVDVPKSKL